MVVADNKRHNVASEIPPIVMNNLEARDFDRLSDRTKQLALAVVRQAPKGLDPYLRNLAKNLRRSDFVVQKVKQVINSESLVINWQDILDIVAQECLKPFHKETFVHLWRLKLITEGELQMLETQSPEQMEDFGHQEFRLLQHPHLTELDKQRLVWAACFHDLCRMAYLVKFWNFRGAFSEKQRLLLDHHASLFSVLGELFNVDPWVTALSVLHHFPNKHYPKNGAVQKLQPYLQDQKFLYLLHWLVTNDCYGGSTDDRCYRDEPWNHWEVIAKRLPGELRGIGMAFVVFLEALMQKQGGGQILCPI